MNSMQLLVVVAIVVGHGPWLVDIAGQRSRLREVTGRARSAGKDASARDRSGSPAVGLRLSLATAAAAVRAGSSLGQAWDLARVPTDSRGIPRYSALQTLANVDVGAGPGRSLRHRFGLRKRRFLSDAVADQQAAAVRSACAVALELGTPLAEVLDHLGASLGAHRDAHQERLSALAGPRTSARVLGWMPVVMMAGAMLFGASPLQTFLDGGIGSLAGVFGVLLLYAGHRWTAALIERASR